MIQRLRPVALRFSFIRPKWYNTISVVVRGGDGDVNTRMSAANNTTAAEEESKKRAKHTQSDQGTAVRADKDAPGWRAADQGPACWKCKGSGAKLLKSPKQAPSACSVCEGKGTLPPKTLKKTKQRPPRDLPLEYVIPGPPCVGASIEIDPSNDELCSLLGHWRILQSLKGGHRWSTDDLLTAYVACSEANLSIKSHLDLGCGLGTVLMMTAWYFHSSAPKGVGIEAQQTSAERARKSIMFNGVQDRLRVVESDFRNVSQTSFTSQEAPFDLITGTPPYFPIEFEGDRAALPLYGGMPTHVNSAPARFEFRGGIEEYVDTAARFVRRPGGVIVLCEGNLAARPRHLERIFKAAERNKLSVVRSVMVHGRDDKPALFGVHVLRPTEFDSLNAFKEERFDVRHLGGKRTAQYLEMCTKMGIALFSDAVPSECVADSV